MGKSGHKINYAIIVASLITTLVIKGCKAQDKFDQNDSPNTKLISWNRSIKHILGRFTTKLQMNIT